MSRKSSLTTSYLAGQNDFVAMDIVFNIVPLFGLTNYIIRIR